MGRTVRVNKTKKNKFVDGSDTYGHWNPFKFEIYIADGLTSQQEDQTFYHEFVHAAFDVLGYADLSSNEQLVDQMASLIQQMIKTSK